MPDRPMSIRVCRSNYGLGLYGTDGEFIKWLPQTDWLLGFLGWRWNAKTYDEGRVFIPESEYENLTKSYSHYSAPAWKKDKFWNRDSKHRTPPRKLTQKQAVAKQGVLAEAMRKSEEQNRRLSEKHTFSVVARPERKKSYVRRSYTPIKRSVAEEPKETIQSYMDSKPVAENIPDDIIRYRAYLED